jgi:putative cell wall binding repeat protein
VAQHFFAGPASAGVASGATYADALAGGVDAVRNGGPLLLTDPHGLPEVVSDYLRTNAATIDAVDVYGGSFSVADSVLPQLQTAIT